MSERSGILFFQFIMIFAIGVVLFRTYVFFEAELIGTYVSNAEIGIGELPGAGAELTLLPNGQFLSTFNRNGVWEIHGNQLHLSYEFGYWKLPLERKWNVGTPMISLYSDLKYYMIKQ